LTSSSEEIAAGDNLKMNSPKKEPVMDKYKEERGK
jgi:hypothetical protein